MVSRPWQIAQLFHIGMSACLCEGRWHCHLEDGDHVLSLSGTSKLLAQQARNGRCQRSLAAGDGKCSCVKMGGLIVACPIPTHSMCWNHLHACRPTSTCSFDFIWLLFVSSRQDSFALAFPLARSSGSFNTFAHELSKKWQAPRKQSELHRNTTLEYDKSLCTTASIWDSECHCLSIPPCPREAWQLRS